jgi:cellulose synthase/poly-beta-1,6-N-acetylglucosamine synthase-like glycosyltransferase
MDQPEESPPESRWRFRWWDYPVFAALTILHLAVTGFVLYRWINADEIQADFIFPILVGTLLVQLILWEWRWLALPLMRVPREIPAASGWRIAVAVTFVPGAESIEMLEQTVKAIIGIDYPHDTWVLDEGDDAEVRDLCLRTGARHFSRQHMPQYQTQSGPFKSRTKYGNYNAWLQEHGYRSYNLLVAFDSDHIPRPNYLHQVLGYFSDESVAYVQPAQVYYNQQASFIAAAAAEETYAYYSSIQMISFAVGFPMIVGCHNAHRITALRQIGGFAPHEADDMVMALLYRANGWQGVYLPKILARGLTPVNWATYLQQQRRWARSVLDFKVRVFPRYASRLPVLQRMLTYLHGLYYFRGPLTALQITLLLFMLVTNIVPGGTGTLFLLHTGAIWLTLLICDFYRQRFYLNPRREWGLHWRSAFVGFVKWPYFVLALADAIRGKYGIYPITDKTRSSKTAVGFAVTHGAVLVLILTAWGIHFLRGPAEFIPLHIATGFTAFASLAAVITSFCDFPPTYQSEVRRKWNEREETEKSGLNGAS